MRFDDPGQGAYSTSLAALELPIFAVKEAEFETRSARGTEEFASAVVAPDAPLVEGVFR